MSYYDLIIIGGGPAGLCAGLYATRAKLNAVLIEKGIPGGQVLNTYEIENYPGFVNPLSGMELISLMEQQVKRLGLEIISGQEIESVNLTKGIKEIITNTTTYNTKTVIIASGSRPSKLGIPGEDNFKGRGVTYCATCDGPFFKDKKVVVIGGGNAAVEEGMYLTKFTKSVKIIHRRDKLRADPIVQEKAFKNPKIEFIWNSVPIEILGDKKVEEIKIKNVKNSEITILKTDGVFIYIGFKANTEFLKNQVKLDDNGFIITDEDMKTSLPGVFACGDVRSKKVKQIVTAVSDGAIATISAQKYLEDS